MKLDVIQKLDEIIDTPTKYTQEEKLNILAPVVRDIAMQVRGHYNDIGLLKSVIENIKNTINQLDNKLFGDKNKQGVIYELSASIKELNSKMKLIIWIGGIIAGAIILNIMGNIFSIPELKGIGTENQEIVEVINK
jgi:hypothetical protein